MLLSAAAAAFMASSSVEAAASESGSGSGSSNKAADVKKTLLSMDFDAYPQRTSDEAAVVEWGHSAIISALDAVVAGFGPQTSRGAFFEVEASPVYADPIDGVGEVVKKKKKKEGGEGEDGGEEEDEDDGELEYPGPLKNKDEVHGNMVVMTNTADLSPVTLARIAKDSGAAALMVVNTADGAELADYVYRMEAETDEEAAWAEENVDIPVVMISRTSGNVLTTATIPEAMRDDPNAGAEAPNGGMPERVRLYAGGDRPFFEDAAAEDPTIYLIHNLLTASECTDLIASAEKAGFEFDGRLPGESNGGRVALWQGLLIGHGAKQIEERIEQVTGYPSEHYSDWQVSKYFEHAAADGEGGSADGYADPHYDYATAPPRSTPEQQEAAVGKMVGLRPHQHPVSHVPMATVSVFLNELGEPVSDPADYAAGGEIAFPNVKGLDPLKVAPRVGLGVVHHNTNREGSYDPHSVHADMPLRAEGAVKYIARKFVYDQPLPRSRRDILPLLAMVNRGRLPGFAADGHDLFVDKFGLVEGSGYFDKAAIGLPILIFVLIAGFILDFVKAQMAGGDKDSAKAGDSKKGEKKKKVKKEGVKKETGGSSGGSKSKKKKKA